MKHIGFQYNDGGRRDAGFKGDTGDCVVPGHRHCDRNAPYKDVYKYHESGVARAKALRGQLAPPTP